MASFISCFQIAVPIIISSQPVREYNDTVNYPLKKFINFSPYTFPINLFHKNSSINDPIQSYTKISKDTTLI